MVVVNTILIWLFYTLLMSNINYKYGKKTNKLFCGLIGFSGPDNFDVDKIKTLLLWNSLERGEDSTGLYSPINGLKKSLLRGSLFVISKDNNNVIEPDNFLIAHVRAATVGSKDELKNAHPFLRGNCVLAHNGTLRNHYALFRKYQLGTTGSNYSVDSDILCGIIGKTKTFNVLKEINGAAALLISDTDDLNTLYVFRNKERPLYKGYVGANMYISSIEEALQFIGCINIKEFKEDCIYTIKNGSIVGTVKKIKNTPYSEPITTTTTIDRSIKFATANGGWVRCNTSATWVTEDKKSFRTIADEYYHITNIIDNNNIEIYDPVTADKYIMKNEYFNENDIPTSGDYLISIYDVYLKPHGVNKPSKVLGKGEVVKVSYAYTDKDVSYVIPTYGQSYGAGTQMVYLRYFRKLTAEELQEYNTLKELSPFLNLSTPPLQLSFTDNEKIKPTCEVDTFSETTTEDEEALDIINGGLSLDTVEGDDITDENEDGEDLDLDYCVNEDDLRNLFTTIDDKLENMLNLKTMEEMKNAIKNLIDFNTIEFDNYFPVKEENNA